MYGVDESGYYHIEIPHCTKPAALKSIMTKGQVAEVMIKALDNSFKHCKPLHFKVVGIEDEYTDKEEGKSYNFNIVMAAEEEVKGLLSVCDKYEDGEIILDLQWPDDGSTLRMLKAFKKKVIAEKG
jgi:hypothetical protein